MGLILLTLACTGEATSADKPAEDTEEFDTAQPVDSGLDDSADTGGGETGHTGETGKEQPTDADEDGSPVEEDCDDNDPWRYPGAADYCDGVDQDCDGDPVGAGMCGEWTTLDDLETLYWIGEEAGEWFGGGPFADFDGSMLMGGGLLDLDEGAFAYVLFEGLPTDSHRWSDNLVGWWGGRAGVTEVNYIETAGDFNGDGWDDLWVSTGDRGIDRGDFRLQLGPTSVWPGRGSYGDEVDDAVWYETPEENETLSPYARSGADIDGDGYNDIVHGAPRGVTLLFGRADVAGQHDLLREPCILEDDPTHTVLSAEVASDFDGDGLRELTMQVSGTYDVLSWLSGEDVAAVDEVARSAVQRTLPFTMGIGAFRPLLPDDVGDLDGDGIPDLVVELSDAVEGEPPCMAWLSAAAVPTAERVEDTLLAEVCWFGTDLTADVYLGTGDVDDDGVADPRFAVSDPDLKLDYGYNMAGCPFGTTQLELGGTVDASLISPCYHYLGGPVPDLDGDGRADYTGQNMEWLENDTDNYGRSDIVLGFDIPWGDASKW